MKKYLFLISMAMATAFVSFPTADVQAQCPMCRMSAESNLKAGGTAGRGLNRGILYMLAMPYLLVGTMGYIWYRNRVEDSGERLEA